MTAGQDRASTAVLAISGDLDVVSSSRYSSQAHQLLAADGIIRLTLDLEEVAFIDSSGIGLLVEIRSECVRRGVDLVLIKVPRRTSALLGLSGLTGAFQIGDPLL
jgi:anti-sigma B factor antagonist